MNDPQGPPTPPERSNADEPIARWENEGGACDERDAAARPAPTLTQDGQATPRL
jgi:hypothetical protein